MPEANDSSAALGSSGNPSNYTHCASRQGPLGLYKRAWRCFSRALNYLQAAFGGFFLGMLNDDEIASLTEDYYSSRSGGGGRFYKEDAYNLRGLFAWEEAAVDKYFKNLGSLLVVGAGAGRETIALYRRGHQVEAFECNPVLVDKGNRLFADQNIPIKIRWVPRDTCPKIETKFDGVLIGWAAYGHIFGKAKRVDYLRRLRLLARRDAPILLSFLMNQAGTRNQAAAHVLSARIGNMIRRPLRRTPLLAGDALWPPYLHIFTEAQIREELQEAGYELVELNRERYPCAIAKFSGNSTAAGSDSGNESGAENLPKRAIKLRLYESGSRHLSALLDYARAGFNGVCLGLLNDDQISSLTEEFYSSYVRQEGYLAYNLQGLFDWEERAIQKHFAPGGKILITGAGGGREAIALHQKGYRVEAFECNPASVEQGNALLASKGLALRIRLTPPSACPRGASKYDGVIIGRAAYGHIFGKESRVAYLRALRALARFRAPVLLSFQIKRGGHSRADILSAALGNLIRRPFGRARLSAGDTLGQLYSHVFTEAQVRQELQAAGIQLLEVNMERYPYAVGRNDADD